jgi:fructose-1,6-bisphosphatase/inositol monophosphatase family enzyme
LSDSIIGSVYSTFIYDTFLSKFYDYHRLTQPSSAVHYIDLANGQADAVLECTRKGNLEIGISYGLVKEAGGVIRGINGERSVMKNIFHIINMISILLSVLLLN